MLVQVLQVTFTDPADVDHDALAVYKLLQKGRLINVSTQPGDALLEEASDTAKQLQLLGAMVAACWGFKHNVDGVESVDPAPVVSVIYVGLMERDKALWVGHGATVC